MTVRSCYFIYYGESEERQEAVLMMEQKDRTFYQRNSVERP